MDYTTLTVESRRDHVEISRIAFLVISSQRVRDHVCVLNHTSRFGINKQGYVR